MKKIINIINCLIIIAVTFLLPLTNIKAYDVWTGYTVIGDSLTVHSTPSLGNFNWVEEIPPYISFRVIDSEGDFIKIVYGDDNRIGWVFNGKNTSIRKSSNPVTSYGRPWTTPSKAIIGGSKLIAEGYINAGQYTSYLKKFNVNPNASAKLYSHQYQTNIRAPYGEARTSYSAYKIFLNDVDFTFAIPVFNEMPNKTELSGMSNNETVLTETQLNDSDFEKLLNNQKFPESYKLYLRNIHKKYPKWHFKSIETGLNFNTAVDNEVSKSCVETSTGYGTHNACGNESSNWAMANRESVAYFMDPRNFLSEERIFMFEDLSSYENVTETMVQRILEGSFMAGKSEKDNKNYATIFINAGRENKINPVYLASLVIQEVGRSGNVIQVTGRPLDYYGIRYESLYNFYNIGASGTFTARGGIVWASGGDPSTYKFINDLNIDKPSEEQPSIEPPTDFNKFITDAGYKVDSDYILNINEKTSIESFKNKLKDVNVIVSSNGSYVGTGTSITLSKNDKTNIKTVIIKGDTDGDGQIKATDYVGIKNSIMEIKKFNNAQNLGADMNNNGFVDAGDYVAIKNYIMSN